MSKWIDFDASLGDKQKLPKERKPVLVIIENTVPGFPNPIVVGYLKFAAGEKDSPQFITPGATLRHHSGEMRLHRILAWSDELSDGFSWPVQMQKKDL